MVLKEIGSSFSPKATLLQSDLRSGRRKQDGDVYTQRAGGSEAYAFDSPLEFFWGLALTFLDPRIWKDDKRLSKRSPSTGDFAVTFLIIFWIWKQTLMYYNTSNWTYLLEDLLARLLVMFSCRVPCCYRLRSRFDYDSFIIHKSHSGAAGTHIYTYKKYHYVVTWWFEQIFRYRSRGTQFHSNKTWENFCTMSTMV